MLKHLLFFALLAFAYARHKDKLCKDCEYVVKMAEHHFQNNNITDEAALKTQLLIECQFLGKHEGPEAAQHCVSVVNANMDKIFHDIQSGDSVKYTCQDIGECPKPTPTPPSRNVTEPFTWSPANTTNTPYWNSNSTSLPLGNSTWLPSNSTWWPSVNTTATPFWNYTGNSTAYPNSNSTWLPSNSTWWPTLNSTATPFWNITGGNSTAYPNSNSTWYPNANSTAFPYVNGTRLSAAKHDPCRTCDLMLTIATLHLTDNMDQHALTRILSQECRLLGLHEGKEASDHCQRNVIVHGAKIHEHLSNGLTARQTCFLLGDCPRATRLHTKKH